MFARRSLWLAGIDYAHGTGHGVGQYLGVHEGPHSLKNLESPPFVEGNFGMRLMRRTTLGAP